MSPAFVVLLLLTVTAAVFVVTTKNIIHASVFLGLTFLGVAGIYLLLNAPFLAFAQVMIYVGAVTVLILFAVMLTAQRIMREPRHGLAWRSVSAVVALVVFGTMFWVVDKTQWPLTDVEPVDPNAPEYLEQITRTLLQSYLFPFEVASVLLLVALVGAIVLAKEERD